MFRLEWHKRDFAVFSLKAGDSVMPVHNTYLVIYTNLICTVGNVNMEMSINVQSKFTQNF